MSQFLLNYFVVSGILGSDPQPAPYISPTAVHFELMIRSPFAPDEDEYKEKFFYPVDLYAYGQQGDILTRYYKKGMHVTIFGRICGQKINVRGRVEGIPRLRVDGIDLKRWYKDLPTAEELGYTPAKSSGEPGQNAEIKNPKKKKTEFIY